MGLINNWLSKKKKEQLQNAGAKPQGSALPKSDAKKPAAKAEPAGAKEAPKAAYEQNEARRERKGRISEHSQAHRILIKPLVTEKSAIAESINKYSFVVARWAGKNQVKKAVEDIYGVAPASVNIINADGRAMHFGRNLGRRSDYKKAIVTLPSGKSIDIHTGV